MRRRFARLDAGDEHGDAGHELFDLAAHGVGGARVGEEIAFVEHNHGLGAALAGCDEEALDACGVVVAVESADEKHGVDVGRDKLLDLFVSGGATREGGAAREQRMDVRTASVGLAQDGHPVADRRVINRRVRLMMKASGAFAQKFGVRRLHGVIVAAQLHDHARGLKAGGGMRLESGGPDGVPAEIVERSFFSRFATFVT